MIKNFLFATVLVALGTTTLSAQKIACVDINEILDKLPEYSAAQTELDQYAAQWRQQIDQEHDKIKGLYSKYQAEQVLMSDDMRRAKEDEIVNAEKAVRQLQKDKFGPEGALFHKRSELVQPIQDRVYNAIEDFASERGYDFIFDKGGSAGIIFAGDKYDKTQEILTKLK